MKQKHRFLWLLLFSLLSCQKEGEFINIEYYAFQYYSFASPELAGIYRGVVDLTDYTHTKFGTAEHKYYFVVQKDSLGYYHNRIIDNTGNVVCLEKNGNSYTFESFGNIDPNLLFPRRVCSWGYYTSQSCFIKLFESSAITPLAYYPNYGDYYVVWPLDNR